MLVKALETLQKYFGYSNFRPGQTEVVLSILEKKDTIAIMPTGAGKSICYQVPALCFDGATIVISPLIALMKDQVDTLVSKNIPATFINSSLSIEEVNCRIEGIKSGLYKIIYVAPERLTNPYFITDLKQCDISMIAVDEAHCISQWGHDFRPSYTKIKVSIDKIAEGKEMPVIAALTATATIEVKEDIVKQLQVINPNVFVSGFKRDNLEIISVNTKNDSDKIAKIINIAKKISGPKLIYATTRKNVEDVFENLLANGISTLQYHAGMTAEERKVAQDVFLAGRCNCMVSTNAFGMGIDKSDIRLIIHCNMPGSIEAYYQEIGRAGRDGKKSSCVLLYGAYDRFVHEFFINNENPSKKSIEEVYFTLLNKSMADNTDDVSITTGELMCGISDGVSEMALSACLKELEKHELIKRLGDAASEITIKLLDAFDNQIQKISPRAKSQQEFLITLRREFGLEKQDQEVEFNLDQFAEKINITRDSALRTINVLNKAEIIEYTPAKKGRLIKILKKEIILGLDGIAIEDKKERALTKLNVMEEFCLSNVCRHKFILGYFGDNLDHVENDCGMCDNCLKKRMKKI